MYAPNTTLDRRCALLFLDLLVISSTLLTAPPGQRNRYAAESRGRLMKHVATIFIMCFLFEAVLGHESQLNAQYYSFRVAGHVVFKKHQSQRGATIYVMWNGPVNGRIPWAH